MKRSALFPYYLIAILGVVGIIVLAGIGLAQTDHAEDAGEEDEVLLDPEEVYNQNCMMCHGGDLTGQTGPTLHDLGSKFDLEEVVDIINNGIEGTIMTGDYATAEQAQVLAEWLLENY